ncbi:UDP-N-acetylglucosamine 4,6-dehydratase [hydrothermal vent metagenome]|uniref:UDP-N-acetylglucosamine 4,6-dehydratase n=1 Tax=hydrothermal vent metagenome TaxID=652676 RepID=A0A1W1CBK1_9ZZZZ
MINIDKRIVNAIVIIVLTFITFIWTFWIFHEVFQLDLVLFIIAIRLMSSLLLFKDYSLSWSKSSQKTFLRKSILYIIAFLIYVPFYYSQVPLYFLISELFLYLFAINFLMYSYYYYINKSAIKKTSNVIIYGAGNAGLKLRQELELGKFKVLYFIDDDAHLQTRSIDTVSILSQAELIYELENHTLTVDLLIIAMPSIAKKRINSIYKTLHKYIKNIKTLPSLEDILKQKSFSTQLKDISLSDLLARHPQDLDKSKISSFIQNKTILITGAGGSIGSEIVRQCIKFKAKKLILLDHSEYNLYQIDQEVSTSIEIIPIMQSIVNKVFLEKTFEKYKPQIVIHAAAYKHVPMVESNIEASILNNVMGTKNCIDLAIHYKVEKFVLISTDKAVRPTNVMGTTKRICELYAQNVKNYSTQIVAVRFGNVLGSSGSVIPKFQKQIDNNLSLTVTHPEITRYFMLIPEACELVLQAGAIGKGGEIFILDMGEPIKIVDLAQKMIDLSGKEHLNIEFSGLRQGEKLYEELLLDKSNSHTKYDSITIAKPTFYPIDKLNKDIEVLLKEENKLKQLKIIVPEFNHKKNI